MAGVCGLNTGYFKSKILSIQIWTGVFRAFTGNYPEEMYRYANGAENTGAGKYRAECEKCSSA